MSKVLVALPASSDSKDWTDEEKAVVEAAGLVFTYGYGDRQGEQVLAPRAVIARFQHMVERTGLDPMSGQVYCIGRAGRDGIEWSFQTGIDGFRVTAQRSGKYAGQDPAEWLTKDGEWVEAFIKGVHGEHPLAARATVYRHDWSKPAVGIATWDEYLQTKRDGKPTAMWAQRGPGQLAKCAEALAIRKAFPQDLSGVYTDDEMRAVPTEVTELEPSEDWEGAIEGAKSREELDEVAVRMKDAGEVTDRLRAAWLARAGVLSRGDEADSVEPTEDDAPEVAETVEAELVEDPAPVLDEAHPDYVAPEGE